MRIAFSRKMDLKIQDGEFLYKTQMRVFAELEKFQKNFDDRKRDAVKREVAFRREIQSLKFQAAELERVIAEKDAKIATLENRISKCSISKIPIIRVKAYKTHQLPGSLFAKALCNFQHYEKQQRILREEQRLKMKEGLAKSERQILQLSAENSRLQQNIIHLRNDRDKVVERHFIDLAIKLGAEIPFMLRDVIGLGSYPMVFEIFRMKGRPEFINIVNGTRELRRKVCHPSFDEKYKSIKWPDLLECIQKNYPNTELRQGLIALCDFVQTDLKIQTPFQG